MMLSPGAHRDLPRLDRIDAYVAHGAARHPERDALIGEDGSPISWGELPGRVDAWAAALLDAGVQPGDRVGVLGNSSAEALVTFLAAAGIGAIWLGLNPKYKLPELDYVVGDAGPSVLVSLLKERAVDEPFEAMARSVGAHVLPADAPRPAAPGDVRLEDARSAVQRTDPAALVYTSGSTGRPKGALLTHAGLVDCALVQDEHWNTDTPPRTHNAFPINHVAWLGDVCCATLVAGGAVAFASHFDPGQVLRTVEAERLTHLGAVPTMYLYLVDAPEWRSCDLSSLEALVFSGAAMPLELARTLAGLGVPLRTGYGMTETTGSVTFTDPDADLETIATTIGRPDPRYELRLINADGHSCEDGQPGEIRVRSHTNLAGYFGRPEAMAESFDADGFLRTGDQAVRLPDGNLRLVGRLREMFKSGGYNVYPREVEEALEQHPAVDEAAVVGIPDAEYGEIGVAFVTGTGVEPAALRAFARERLANYKVPKAITVLEALPRLPVGKVDKLVLRTQAASRA